MVKTPSVPPRSPLIKTPYNPYITPLTMAHIRLEWTTGTQSEVGLRAQERGHQEFGGNPQRVHVAVSKNWGPLFGSPYKKSPSILGSRLGPPIVGNSYVDIWYILGS